MSGISNIGVNSGNNVVGAIYKHFIPIGYSIVIDNTGKIIIDSDGKIIIAKT